MGILYFIQPAELVGTTRFKVGCSTKNDLSRVKSYKAGTRMIMILQCEEDPFLLEQKILVEFKNQFHKIAGNEYFEGDESVMRKVFYDTYQQWEHHKKDGIAKWRNEKLKEQQQRLVQLQKDFEILKSEIVEGEAYLDRVMRGEEDEAILAQHKMTPSVVAAEKTVKHLPLAQATYPWKDLETREKTILKKETDRTSCVACHGSGTSYWSDDCYGSCMECCCIDCEKFADECTCIEPTVRVKLGQTYPPEIDDDGKLKHLRFNFDARDDKDSNTHNQHILNLFEQEFKHKWVTIHSHKGTMTAYVGSEAIDMTGEGTVGIILKLIEYFE